MFTYNQYGRRHICLHFDHFRRHLNFWSKKSSELAENGVWGFSRAPWILTLICARVQMGVNRSKNLVGKAACGSLQFIKLENPQKVSIQRLRGDTATFL